MALTVLRRNQLGSNKNHSLFLISDTNGEVRNIPYESLVKALKNKAVDITNLTLTSQGLLKGSCGDLNRYPLVRFKTLDEIANNKMYTSVIENGYNITILGQCSDGLYKIANLNGVVLEATEQEVINLCTQMNGSITNASIVENKFIRPIYGQFRRFGPSKKGLKHVDRKIEQKIEKKVEKIERKVEKEKIENPTVIPKVSSQKVPLQLKRDYKQLQTEIAGYRQEAKTLDTKIKDRDANLRSTYRVKNDSEITVNGESINVDYDTAKSIRRLQKSELLQGNLIGYRMPKISKIDYTNGDYDALEGGSAIAKTSFHGMNDPRNGKISIEAKIMLAATTLKAIDPFVYAAYLELKQVLMATPAGGINTMAVSDDTLYMVQPAIERLELPQISWLMLHEISHILGRHLIRRGNRDPYIWNIACDLYNNKMIADEFGCKPGVPVQKMLYNNIAPIGLEFHLEMDEKTGSFLMSMYSEAIDSKKDTVEIIYDKLMAENQEKLDNKSPDDNSKSGNDESGNSYCGDDTKPDESSKDKPKDTSSESSTQEKSDGSEKSENDCNGQDGSESNGTTPENCTSKSDKNSGSGQSEEELNGNTSNGKDEKTDFGKSDDSDECLTFDGQPIAPLSGGGDMYEDDDTSEHGSSPEARNEWAEAFLKRIIQRSKSFNTGSNSAMLRMAEEALVEDFVWTNFVKQYLTKLAGTDYSYSKPNRKGYSRPYFTKGKIKNEKLEEEAVYVCIDVSGSVTDKDLYKSFEYIRILLNKLNIKGYVMFWSTSIDEPKPFKNSSELIKIRNNKYKSSGGTDPTCVFNFFKSKQCREKPNLVIMITDGYFTMPPKELRPRCETLWIITDKERNYKMFKPSFGKVAPLIPKV